MSRKGLSTSDREHCVPERRWLRSSCGRFAHARPTRGTKGTTGYILSILLVFFQYEQRLI